jgi:hypothetical protein
MQQELPVVRIATRADEEEIMAMCRRLHEENGLFTLNEKKVRECLRKCYDREGSVVGVIGEPGNLQASTCLMISSFYYTDDWHLEEHWNFVDKDFRKARNAEALIEFNKACAIKMGIPLFTGIITNKQMAGKVRLYRRLLGHPAGAYFVYNAKWNVDPIASHGELRGRLKEWAKTCNDSPREVTFSVAQKKLGPLLREAAEAISAEDNIWGGSSALSNGNAGSHER